MAGGDTTPQERLEGLLTGTRREGRVAQALAGAGKRNALIGAALHAADRLRRGHAATDLERELLQALRAAMTDAEIKEFGRVYRETVDKLGRLDAVPEVITSRPVDSGYSVANLN
ncbi:hypothetical protein ACIGBH_39520 [Streptomyces sp. NPDC085929]|uniref:hypothetical protein n=1 Tax=Streptomyces sp. NPDC085929 TaxID=3365739 RepID=UPI0037D60435